MAGLDDWDHNPDGNIKVRPLMSYSTALMPLGGVVRLLYAETVEDIDSWNPSALQLHMSGPQARELGGALLRMADKVDQQPKGPKQ